jgi:hypothetical protein
MHNRGLVILLNVLMLGRQLCTTSIATSKLDDKLQKATRGMHTNQKCTRFQHRGWPTSRALGPHSQTTAERGSRLIGESGRHPWLRWVAPRPFCSALCWTMKRAGLEASIE